MRALAGLIVALLLLGSGLVVDVSRARAQPADPWVDQVLMDALDASGLLDEWADASHTSPDLDFVPVYGTVHNDSRALLLDLLAKEQQSAATWASAAATRTFTEQELRLLAEDEFRTRELIDTLALEVQDLDIQRQNLASRIEDAEATLLEITITRYMGGRLTTELQAIGSDTEPVEQEMNRSALLAATDETYKDYVESLYVEEAAIGHEIDRRLSTRDAALAMLNQIGTEQVNTGEDASEIRVELAGLDSENTALIDQVLQMIETVQLERSTSEVPQLGFSLIAFDAYRRAAQAVADEEAICAIDWATIAGISEVESIHGTLGNRFITANGSLSRPLLGVLLDGGASEADGVIDPSVAAESGVTTTSNFARIPDSDGGLWDGSAEYDRALGPMQFLPSTWRRYGADGNGDDVNDPHNIYDASKGAALYLCAVAKEIDSGDLNLRLRSYNDSQTYVNKVMDGAAYLREQVASSPVD